MASYSADATNDAGMDGGEEGSASSAAPPADLPDHKTRVQWFEAWEEKTRQAQQDARRDRDYYDGIQWTREDIDELAKRHQPVITANYIARKVNFILGEEIKKRVDPVARPRTPAHDDDSSAATDALRYVEEEQKFDAVRSLVAKSLLVEGVSGAIKSLDQRGGKYRHKLDHIESDRLFWDPHSRKLLFDDAKYKGVVRWADFDDALADYPNDEETLRAALTRDIGGRSGDTTEDVPRHQWADRERKRVKIIEMYFYEGDDCYRADFVEGGDLCVPGYDEPGPQRTWLMDEDQEHSLCPLVMASCYIDAEGGRYGAVRGMISPQDEINKRLSKELHLLSVNSVVAPKDAIPDPEKFLSELAKPDGLAEYTAGYQIGTDILIRDGATLAQGQHQMLIQAINNINSIGPSSSTLPGLPESASGRAFIARQQAASQELGSFFDAIDQFTQAVFELDWLCIRWAWDEEMWLRVGDDKERRGFRFVALNRVVSRAERMQELLKDGVEPDKALDTVAGQWVPLIRMRAQLQAQQMQLPPDQLPQLIMSLPLMAEPIKQNDVAKMRVDIVIDKAPETAILAQEEAEKLAEVAGIVIPNKPELAPKMVELMIRASQLRDKHELLEVLNQPPDPQQAQLQQAQQQLTMKDAEAEIGVKQSQAQLNTARAASEQAGAQVAAAKAPAEVAKMQADAMRAAAQAGAASAGPGQAPGEEAIP